MGGLEHVVLVVTHPQITVVANYRIQVHVVRVDVAMTLARNAAPLHRVTVRFVLGGDERAPLIVSGLLSLLVVANSIQASKREIEGTVILYISYARLCDMGACAVLSLIFVDDFLLRNTELLTGVVLVGCLPSVELASHFVVDIRADNLDVCSCAIGRSLEVLVRKRSTGLVVFPPDVATSGAINSTLWPLLICSRCLGPFSFRLG